MFYADIVYRDVKSCIKKETMLLKFPKEYAGLKMSCNLTFTTQIKSIIKSIYARKQERMEQGKKITTTDDKYFKRAEDVLFSELSFVLNIPKDKMEQFISDTIEA